MPFDEATLSYLEHYGFDRDLLENWRAGIRAGHYSTANNRMQSPMLAPEAGTIHDFPKRDTEEHAALEGIGLASMRRGELGVVILNGGMATRFGGVVKGTVPVLGKRTFLELKVEDVKRAQKDVGCTIPVYLMNSFATDHATREHCVEKGDFGLRDGQLHHFTQFISVRLTPDGELFETEDGKVSMYGPGHGDFAPAFVESGMLERFLAGGGRYLFLSNVDNLGARVSPLVLGHHIEKGKDMTVEVAPKWPGDVGGAPFDVEGRVQLIEQIRFPEGFDPDIVDVFNTNTFTFTAKAMAEPVELGWYYVEKTVEDRRAVQMERLVGEMTRFLSSNYVRVRRIGEENRFLPMKVPEDLESAREEIEQLYP